MSEQLQALTSNEGLHPRAEKALALLQTKGVSLAAEKAIIRHCNPFPDKDLEPILVPDGAAAVLAYPSMAQLTLSKPAGLTAGLKWGFAVLLHPLADTSSADSVGYTPSAYSWDTGTSPLNPLNGFLAGFCFDDTGQDLNFMRLAPASGVSVPLPAGMYVTPADIIGNVYKVVAQGFEASDVTPELYKGGTFSAAEYEPMVTLEQASVTRAGPVTAKEMVSFVANWPSEYSLLPANKTFMTWEAPKGVYAMNTFRRNKSHKFTQKEYHDCLISEDTSQDANQIRAGNGFRDNGFKVKVLVFRGLDPNAAFNLRRVIYFECQVPSYSAEYKLTTNEPPYDPNFNRILQEIAHAMPVATQFNGNAFGSWFDTVCDVVSGIGSAVGGIFPGVGSVIGGGVASAAQWAKGVNASFRAPSNGESGRATDSVTVYQRFESVYKKRGLSGVPKKFRAAFLRELEDMEGWDELPGDASLARRKKPSVKRAPVRQRTFLPSPQMVPVPGPNGLQLVSTKSPIYKAVVAALRKTKGKRGGKRGHKKFFGPKNRPKNFRD